MTLRFDGYMSEPLALTKELNQGCSLLEIAFQFYNTDVVALGDASSREEAITFMDNTLLIACDKTLNNTNNRVKHMMTRNGRGQDWSNIH